ncbi:MAG: H/ACA ribonucleoprotein complex subunit GAR1 [Candidatus Hydrothermarchaeota archaeon]
MRKLGKVSHISPQNHLIARTNFLPKIGSTVLSENREIVGRVLDVFGPVNSPYVSIVPDKKVNSQGMKSLVGSTLYILNRKRRSKGAQKKRSR